MNCWKLSPQVLVLTAIATVILPAPTLAQTPSPPTSSNPLCRVVTLSTPVFARADTTSAALKILPAAQTVLLKTNPTAGSPFGEITTPLAGYVQTALLQVCQGQSGSLPEDIDTNPIYCRRLRTSAIDGPDYSYLDHGLVARDAPDGGFHYDGLEPDGPAAGAVVRITRMPPEVQDSGDRSWVRIKYTSRSNTQRIGWIPNGPAGVHRNIANCLPAQN